MRRGRIISPAQYGRGLYAAPTLLTGSRTWTGSDFFGSDWTILNRGGELANGEQQWYDPAAVTLDGSSNLKIQLTNTAQGGYSYTAGMLQWASYSYLYGTLKIRCQMPGGTGAWPALWLLGTGCQSTNPSTPDNGGTCNWPNPGSDEIDFIEIMGNNYSVANCVTHMTAGQAGPAANLASDCSVGFHDWQLDWSPGSLIWKYDGTQIASISGGGVPSNPAFLIINVAVSPGIASVNTATWPLSLLVQSVQCIPA
jgi:beta-glucanase (GH16 family)